MTLLGDDLERLLIVLSDVEELIFINCLLESPATKLRGLMGSSLKMLRFVDCKVDAHIMTEAIDLSDIPQKVQVESSDL